MQKRGFSNRNTSLYGSHTSPVVLCMKNSVICTRMTSVCGFQPSSVVFSIQNSDFWSRITSLYVSQTSPVVLCMQISVISTGITRLHGSHPSSLVFASKTATFGPELLVSMDSSPHLCFLDAKQRLLDQNYKSLCVPDLTCRFVYAKQRD